MGRYEIRLSGSGGQGMITAGIIIANAAAIYEHKKSIQSQSYGPEARGGASKAEVIISDEDINFPKVTAPDVLIALTQEAYDKYSKDLKKGGVLITDSHMVTKINTEGFKVYSLPILQTVNEKLGKALSLNIAVLGVLNSACHIISEDALLKSIISMVPKGTEEANKQAFYIGVELVGKNSE